MQRYQYLIKIRSYLVCNRNEEAANLLDRLYVYAIAYKRTYIEMECEILRAIVQYRMDIGDYKKTLREELTDTERRILHLYCEGITSHDVCELCCFCYNTLKYHNRNIYKKLRVSNRAEAERVGHVMFLK